MKAVLRLLLLAVCFVSGFSAALAASTNSFQIIVELKDGSRLMGRSLDERLEFHSETLGAITLPLEQIASIESLSKTNSVKLIATNGDSLTAAFALREIRVRTSFGMVKLPVDSVRRLLVTAANLSGRPKAGLVALWSAEGNANDSIGSCNGQLVNGVQFATGKVGRAFDFNENFSSGFGGVEEDDGFTFQTVRRNRVGGYVLIPTTPDLDVGKQGGFTFEFWIKPATVARQELIAEYERVLGTANGEDAGLDLVIQPSAILYANISDIDHVSHEISAPPNLLVAGEWQHVAFTYDKASGSAAIYKNGVIIAQASLGSFTTQTSYANFLIGARTTFGSPSRPNTLFSGKIDEFGIYNRALSAAEIQAIYAEENGEAAGM